MQSCTQPINKVCPYCFGLARTREGKSRVALLTALIEDNAFLHIVLTYLCEHQMRSADCHVRVVHSLVASALVLRSDAPLEPDGIPWAHIASYAPLALRGIIVRRRALAPGHVSQRRLASIGPSRASVSDHWSIMTCTDPTSPLNSIALITPLQMNCTYDWQVRVGRDSNNTIHTRIIC